MAINIRINKPFGGYAEGRTVKVEVDDTGTPLDAGWRRRLKDAALDGCCEIVAERSGKAASSKKSSEGED